MTLFQVITILFLGYFTVQQLRNIKSKSFLKLLYELRWLGLSSLAILVIAFPGVSSQLASVFGITRGVDIVIYSSIIWLFYRVYSLNEKVIQLEDKMDDLVREIALDEEQV